MKVRDCTYYIIVRLGQAEIDLVRLGQAKINPVRLGQAKIDQATLILM